ncbi:MAG: hypothetical protein AB1483_00015 [Candidatus Zixiibacteriota bacterium]
MFCPKCRYEYEAGVEVCPDCDEPLVASLPVEDADDGEGYEDWVQLARLTSQQSAAMILEVLREKDIPAVILSGAGHFGLTGQMGPSSYRPIDGAYSVVVPEDFVVDADREGQAILGEEWERSRLVDIGEE